MYIVGTLKKTKCTFVSWSIIEHSVFRANYLMSETFVVLFFIDEIIWMSNICHKNSLFFYWNLKLKWILIKKYKKMISNKSKNNKPSYKIWILRERSLKFWNILLGVSIFNKLSPNKIKIGWKWSIFQYEKFMFTIQRTLLVKGIHPITKVVNQINLDF